MLTDSQHAAAMAYAQTIIDREYSRQREYNPERFAKCAPEFLREYEDSQRKAAVELTLEILDREELLKHVGKGRFHPSNSASHKLFTAITGVRLPKGSKATIDVLHEQIGNEYVKTWYAKREAERAANENAERQAKENAEQRRLAELRGIVAQGEAIDGDSLVELARSLGVDIHPRTVGMIRKRVYSISAGSARIAGKGKVTTAFALYRDCRKKILDNPPIVY